MFDFQLDIFETVMKRFRLKLEMVAQSDIAFEVMESNGEYVASFNILKSGENCHLRWSPRRFLVLDVYPAVRVMDGDPEGMEGFRAVLDLVFDSCSCYGLHCGIAVVGRGISDDMLHQLDAHGFKAVDGSREAYIVRPTPKYLGLFEGAAVRVKEVGGSALDIETDAIRVANGLPRMSQDAAPYKGKGGVSTMSLR